MSTKKKNYQEMLKENLAELAEFDTTKTVDVKGPMLDPILGYEGDGELPTYKDAASVLERYYFGEKKSENEINEMDYENDKGDSSGESMKDTEGPEGEEQAGTSSANDTVGAAKEKEKDIVKEEDKAISEKEMSTKDLKSANMKDAEGPEDEEQAGTGDTYKDFKKRVVESIGSIAEEVDNGEDDAEDADTKKDEDDEDKDKASDSKEKEEMEEQGSGAGHVPVPALQKKMKNEDQGEDYEDDEDAKGIKEAKDADTKEDEADEDEDEDKAADAEEEEEDITEALENEIIEKIISEMEELDEQDETPEQDAADVEDQDKADDEAEEDEEDEGLDVDQKMEEMVNRLTQGHTEGPGGEEQAGTGGDEKVIPPRKDRSNEGTGKKGTKAMDKSELADS